MPEQAVPLVVETGVNLRTPNNHQRDSPNSPPWTPDSPSPLCKKEARSIRLQSRRRRHHVTVFSKSEDWEISAAPTTAPTSAESPATCTEVFVALSTAEIAELRRVERQGRGRRGEPEPQPEPEPEPEAERKPGWFTACCARPAAAHAQAQARAKPATRQQLPQRTRSEASMESAPESSAEDSFESARRMLRKTMSEDW